MLSKSAGLVLLAVLQTTALEAAVPDRDTQPKTNGATKVRPMPGQRVVNLQKLAEDLDRASQYDKLGAIRVIKSLGADAKAFEERLRTLLTNANESTLIRAEIPLVFKSIGEVAPATTKILRTIATDSKEDTLVRLASIEVLCFLRSDEKTTAMVTAIAENKGEDGVIRSKAWESLLIIDPTSSAARKAVMETARKSAFEDLVLNSGSVSKAVNLSSDSVRALVNTQHRDDAVLVLVECFQSDNPKKIVAALPLLNMLRPLDGRLLSAIDDFLKVTKEGQDYVYAKRAAVVMLGKMYSEDTGVNKLLRHLQTNAVNDGLKRMVDSVIKPLQGVGKNPIGADKK